MPRHLTTSEELRCNSDAAATDSKLTWRVKTISCGVTWASAAGLSDAALGGQCQIVQQCFLHWWEAYRQARSHRGQSLDKGPSRKLPPRIMDLDVCSVALLGGRTRSLLRGKDSNQHTTPNAGESLGVERKIKAPCRPSTKYTPKDNNSASSLSPESVHTYTQPFPKPPVSVSLHHTSWPLLGSGGARAQEACATCGIRQFVWRLSRTVRLLPLVEVLRTESISPSSPCEGLEAEVTVGPARWRQASTLLLEQRGLRPHGRGFGRDGHQSLPFRRVRHQKATLL